MLEFSAVFRKNSRPGVVNRRSAFPRPKTIKRKAQKPVALSEIPIRNHLEAGEAVYDAFLGSGTTLIAAEALGRRCLGMEIDPKYCQIAIERWQNFTGRQAERVE